MGLIDADALSKLVGEPIEVFLRRLDLKLPPIVDAEPVKHGHWVVTPYTDYDDTYECSVCGACWTFIEGTPKDNEAFYCPHCGARMNEVEDV